MAYSFKCPPSGFHNETESDELDDQGEESRSPGCFVITKFEKRDPEEFGVWDPGVGRPSRDHG